MRFMLAVVIVSASLPLPAAEPPAAGPNVLFLFADDMRADAIASLGNPVVTTPNLDRLVDRGVAFERAYM